MIQLKEKAFLFFLPLGKGFIFTKPEILENKSRHHQFGCSLPVTLHFSSRMYKVLNFSLAAFAVM